MFDINNLPEPLDGLAREVYELEGMYRNSDGFVTFFSERKDVFKIGEVVARRLDTLVKCLAETYSMMSAVASGGTKCESLKFDVFDNAATGRYNETGIVDGGWTPAVVQGTAPKLHPDSEYLLNLASQLQEITRNIPPDENGRMQVLGALKQKLNFEAAVYNAMKQYHSVAVTLPSSQQGMFPFS